MCLNARLISILYNRAVGPSCFKLCTISYTEGYFSSKYEPKYLSLGTPELTDWPTGKLRSRITLLVSELGFSLVRKRDT